MIFRRISYRIAAQFTGFVFALLLLTGTVFLAGDLVQRGRETHARLERQLLQILERPEGSRSIPSLPSFQRERIRITDALGRTIFAGTLYDDVPFSATRTIVTVERGKESYDILTAPFMEDGEIVGYLQVADRSPPDNLSDRVFLFLLVSTGISALTFGVGLFFARRSLKPAEQMMQRLEQFTQDASHELRTPLTAVGTSLDLALSKDDNRELVRAAKKDLKHIAVLVERLLELARLDSLALRTEQIDLSLLLSDVLATHASAMQEKHIVLEKRIAPAIRVNGDPALVRQIVSNLVANAIKFNRDGGTIVIALSKHALSVKDTGKGIAAEALPRVFDRFYQEDDARTQKNGGLGLGLALAKRIAELHGWTIGAASEEGKGAEFTVRF